MNTTDDPSHAHLFFSQKLAVRYRATETNVLVLGVKARTNESFLRLLQTRRETFHAVEKRVYATKRSFQKRKCFRKFDNLPFVPLQLR